MTSPPAPPLLTTGQVAQRWDKPEWLIRKWCAKGGLPGAFHIGQRWLIPLRVVEARENGQPLDPTG